jgi:hypothetical protein
MLYSEMIILDVRCFDVLSSLIFVILYDRWWYCYWFGCYWLILPCARMLFDGWFCLFPGSAGTDSTYVFGFIFWGSTSQNLYVNTWASTYGQLKGSSSRLAAQSLFVVLEMKRWKETCTRVQRECFVLANSNIMRVNLHGSIFVSCQIDWSVPLVKVDSVTPA